MAPEPEHFPSWDGAVNVLRAVQWAGKTSDWDPADREACCPVCERTEAVDCRGIGGVHAPSCALALEAGLPIASADELRAEHAARNAAFGSPWRRTTDTNSRPCEQSEDPALSGRRGKCDVFSQRMGAAIETCAGDGQ